MKLATIIIPHHNRHDHLKTLLDLLNNHLFDIVIVSGGSFAENCNRGATIAKTNNLIFINDDTRPTVNDLLKIVRYLSICDVVGSTQITGKGIKYYGCGFCYDHFAKKPEKSYFPQVQLQPNKSLFPSGFLFGITNNAWELTGGFNTEFKTGYEDVCFGIRCINAGLHMSILDLEIPHAESASKDRFKYCSENIELFDSLYPQPILKQLYENTNYCG